jgi:protein-S-isoprenylcysteine O-methyltransferase Ste14
MRPLVFVWPYALVFWVIYVWVFTPELGIVRRASKGSSDRTSKDAGSLQVIMLGMWLALLLSFPLAFVKALQFPPTASLPAFWSGTVVLVAGGLLRRHCFRVLGEFFTGDVQARIDQPVIDRGAYRWVRHPSYTGGILIFAGIGVALASWASLAILVLVSVAVYSYRVAVEERALVQTIGEPYAAFMRSRKRFVPFIV